MARLASSTLFQAQAAHFRFSPDFGHIAASHRSATKSADATSTSFQAHAAHFRFSPDSGHIAESHRSATKSAEARRLVVNFAKLLGLLRRSPPRSQPQIHDGRAMPA